MKITSSFTYDMPIADVSSKKGVKKYNDCTTGIANVPKSRNGTRVKEVRNISVNLFNHTALLDIFINVQLTLKNF